MNKKKRKYKNEATTLDNNRSSYKHRFGMFDGRERVFVQVETEIAQSRVGLRGVGAERQVRLVVESVSNVLSFRFGATQRPLW